jgi:hypothetical protein
MKMLCAALKIVPLGGAYSQLPSLNFQSHLLCLPKMLMELLEKMEVLPKKGFLQEVPKIVKLQGLGDPNL